MRTAVAARDVMGAEGRRNHISEFITAKQDYWCVKLTHIVFCIKFVTISQYWYFPNLFKTYFFVFFLVTCPKRFHLITGGVDAGYIADQIIITIIIFTALNLSELSQCCEGWVGGRTTCHPIWNGFIKEIAHGIIWCCAYSRWFVGFGRQMQWTYKAQFMAGQFR